MRILFCGTPHFAVPAFIQLLAQPDIEIAAVITQPDRPRGRGHEISSSPVKEAAIAANIPVHQPEKIRSPEARDLLQRLAPDCIVIIAYGQIIPAALLSIPRLGWINLHASLLPKYRGAAPINWAIANGETQTGLTTMRIDAGMDTGGVLLQEEMDIAPEETAPELTESMEPTRARNLQSHARLRSLARRVHLLSRTDLPPLGRTVFLARGQPRRAGNHFSGRHASFNRLRPHNLIAPPLRQSRRAQANFGGGICKRRAVN
jgi:methionyl-tRNA formyltransferase